MAQQTIVGAPAVTRVNLLPPEIAEASRLRRARGGMLAAVVVAVLVVAALYFLQASRLTNAKDDLATAQATHARLVQERQSLANVEAVYADVAAHEALLVAAMGPEIQWSRYLNDLSLTIPDNVWVTTIGATETLVSGAAPAAPAPGSLTTPGIGTVSISGVAFDHTDVATWLETLAREKGFADAYFSASTESFIGTRRVVNFSSSVTLTQDALSGRYLKKAGG
ncbi:MAG: PilN domain-containing protein [Frankia sp.]|nr:PilN domain-containing protein [Frankia sp.]